MSDTVGQAIGDAYQALKRQLAKRFADEPAAQAVLVEYEQDPETFQAPMSRMLERTGAGADAEVLAAAQAVVQAADPQGVAEGKYQVQANVGSVRADRGGVAVAGNVTGGVTAGYTETRASDASDAVDETPSA